jgi:hypothetical protein
MPIPTQLDAAAALTDTRFVVPPVPAGIEWLRCTVARFSAGTDHQRRRGLVVELLAEVRPDALRVRAAARPDTAPVELLAEALGLRNVRAAAVSAVARAFHPHTATDRAAATAADRAVAELVVACGGAADERTAALIGLLVQACDATAALVETVVGTARRRTEDVHDLVADVLRQYPPVRITRRVDPESAVVELDLAAAGLAFGVGAHACPGRAHAVAIAEGVAEAVSGR